MRLFKYLCVSMSAFLIYSMVLKPLAWERPPLKTSYSLTQIVITKNDNKKLILEKPNVYDWESLSENQRTLLVPLIKQWKKFDYAHRAKWIKVATRLDSQPSSVKVRAQKKMYLWINLTVSEKKLARTYFVKGKEIDRKVISGYWLDYQKLPERQRSELAAYSIGNPGVTNDLHQ